MATRLTPEKSGVEEPAVRKAAPKKAAPSEKSVANGPAVSAKAQPATKARRLPAATIRALKELEAGKLTRYADADELFRKLGIKLGGDKGTG
jgi:hypothetical protein